jgi:hypothetical protein
MKCDERWPPESRKPLGSARPYGEPGITHDTWNEAFQIGRNSGFQFVV